eukprot:Selendium_serpulae@DN5772_c0_g2_i1.p1
MLGFCVIIFSKLRNLWVVSFLKEPMPGETSPRASLIEVPEVKSKSVSEITLNPLDPLDKNEESDDSDCGDAMKKPVAWSSNDEAVKSFHIGDTRQPPIGHSDSKDAKDDWWFSSDGLTNTTETEPQVVTTQITTTMSNNQFSTTLSMCDDSDEEIVDFDVNDLAGRWLNGNFEDNFLSRVDRYTQQVAEVIAVVLPAVREHMDYSKRISRTKMRQKIQRGEAVEQKVNAKSKELLERVKRGIVPLFEIDKELHRILHGKFWHNMAQDSVEHRITLIYKPILENWHLLAPYFERTSADQNSTTGTAEFPSGSFLSPIFVKPTLGKTDSSSNKQVQNN